MSQVPENDDNDKQGFWESGAGVTIAWAVIALIVVMVVGSILMGGGWPLGTCERGC